MKPTKYMRTIAKMVAEHGYVGSIEAYYLCQLNDIYKEEASELKKLQRKYNNLKKKLAKCTKCGYTVE